MPWDYYIVDRMCPVRHDPDTGQMEAFTIKKRWRPYSGDTWELSTSGRPSTQEEAEGWWDDGTSG